MKKNKIYIILLSVTIASAINVKAQQTTERLLNLLIEKHVITKSDADSLRKDLVIEKQEVKENQKTFVLNANTPIFMSGYIQSRFQDFEQSGKASSFDIRRARITFDGNISKWDYRINADLASSPKLIDAFIGFKLNNFLKITAGQFYIPFSLENATQDRNLETIDHSQVVSALAARDNDVIGNQNGRDIGIQLSGSILKIKKRFLFDYYAGIFDGAGINVSDNNQSKDFSGRIVFHPIKNLDLGSSYYNGYDMWGTPATQQARKRFGTEFSYTYSFANIKGEYIHGVDGVTEKRGWYLQLGTFVYKKNIQLIARYDTYDPNIAPDKTGDITINYVFGVNFYFNYWSKLQINYTNRKEQIKQIKNDLFATQLQISF